MPLRCFRAMLRLQLQLQGLSSAQLQWRKLRLLQLVNRILKALKAPQGGSAASFWRTMVQW